MAVALQIPIHVVSGVYSSFSGNWKWQEVNSVGYWHGTHRDILKARPFARKHKELLSQHG